MRRIELRFTLMILKYIFDRVVALIGLLFLWPVLLIVAILVKLKMPGGPAFFVQKRVGKDGRLFDCQVENLGNFRLKILGIKYFFYTFVP